MTRGVSLIEFLVCLIVASVLIGLAMPSLGEFVSRQRAVAAVNQIIGAVAAARHAAVKHRATTTLCAAEAGQCVGANRWHLGAMIFKDVNANGTREEDELIVAQLPAMRRGERVYWRSFRNKPYLQFSSRGLTSWQNGSFQYCPADADARLSKAVIINAQGRAAVSRDNDGDGIDESAAGEPLYCR
ncbi:MAG TPA: GspH/FimT family pseudopilin [Pseudomonadales bacterium]|jgi:type IV fimbrial biogenesis protein FimT